MKNTFSNSFNKKNINYFYFIVIFVCVFVPVLFNIYLYFSTKFEKKIKIQDKYTRYMRYGSNYNVIDTENNTYKMDNVWFKGDFNRADEYAKIKIGDSYLVQGYGIRLPFLNMYKKIFNVENV